MKSLFTIFLILTVGFSVQAQTPIDLSDIGKHVGDSVVVCGTVESMRYFENSKRKPTLLNLGAKFPNQLLTVLIWEDLRAIFPGNIDDLLNKEICVTGTVILFKEKPEIIIHRVDQIELKKMD